jgi:hypothetical protein
VVRNQKDFNAPEKGKNEEFSCSFLKSCYLSGGPEDFLNYLHHEGLKSIFIFE